MTDHEISNLQPGPELDRLVAEACGIEYERNPNPSGLHEWEEVGGSIYNGTYQCVKCLEHETNGAYGDEPLPKDGCKPAPILFRPSTDWNDVMRALDRIVGENESLFQADSVRLDCDCNGWVVYLDRITTWHPGDETNNWNDTPLAASCVAEASGESGPLAICRAILKAKQERQVL